MNWHSLQEYVADTRLGEVPQYLGHNRIGKLILCFMFFFLVTQATTGLVLDGTYLYLPTFGHEIAKWVTSSGEEHDKIKNLKPGSKDDVDSVARAERHNFRKPFIFMPVCAFYLLRILIFIYSSGYYGGIERKQ